MSALSHVTVVWSVIAAAALLLGAMHVVRAILDRGSRVDLAFAFMALSFVGVAYTELQTMHARTPEEWAFWIRWCYLPVTGMIIGLVIFVRLYLGTGRVWLAGGLIGLRILILAINAVHGPTVAFDRVDAIASVPFLGDRVTVVSEALTSSWQWLGTVGTFLLVVYTLDATVALWRRGAAEDRRRAAVIGAAVLLYATIGGVYVQLVIWQLTTLPLLITPTFGILVFAMAYELSRDALRAASLARELRGTQRRLELAAGAAEIGLWEWDSRTGRVWATRQARTIFGFADPAPTTIGGWMARIHPDDQPRVQGADAAVLVAGAEHRAEFRVTPPGGEVRWVAASGRVEPADRAPHTLMRGVLRDISSQKRSNDETQALRNELAHAGRVSLLGQLASSLAHELSQPLGAILRNAEAAELVLGADAPDLEELKAIVTDIRRDDRRAGDVIDRLRALLKRRAMDLQAVEIDGLLKDVVTLVHADAASRHIAIGCEVEPGLPPVAGDRVHLSQVLLNLLVNGMDAVSGLEPVRRSITVRARPDGASGVAVEVCDSGPGIPAESLARVFDPFFTTKAAGMGMGLSISRTIAEAHGGRLAAENGPAGGAVFRLVLPAARGLSP